MTSPEAGRSLGVMAPPRPQDLEPLSEQQLPMMLSVWRRGSVSTYDVLEDLEAWEGTGTDFNTYRNVQTQLNRLVKKGYLTVEPGRAGRGGKLNVYEPAMPKAATLRHHLERFVGRLHGDETALGLLAGLLEEQEQPAASPARATPESV